MKRYFLLFILILSLVLTGCSQGSKPVTGNAPATQKEKLVITDMLGRKVEIPDNVQHIATNKFLGYIVYALGQGNKMVCQGLTGPTGNSEAKFDSKYAALPVLKNYGSVEELAALKTQVYFVYADFDQALIKQYEDVGIKVVVLQTESLDQSYQSIRLMGKVLDAEQQAEAYIKYCQDVVNGIQERVKDVPQDNRPKVLFSGPESLTTAATGNMLQSNMVELVGGVNVAKDVTAKGIWAKISLEQLVKWNPDCIFIGSGKGKYYVDNVLNNPALATVNAVKNKRVYIVPSNIGWWDFPAPQCVLGMQWMAKTMYPDKFTDVDVTKFADNYYKTYIGNTFTELGGKL